VLKLFVSEFWRQCAHFVCILLKLLQPCRFSPMSAPEAATDAIAVVLNDTPGAVDDASQGASVSVDAAVTLARHAHSVGDVELSKEAHEQKAGLIAAAADETHGGAGGDFMYVQ
jgi:hypothetical protein